MRSERYNISLFGVDSKYYTDDFVAHVWEESADKQYQQNGVYVTALISVNKLVCGKIRGCDLWDSAHVISCLRNPVSEPDENKYWEALRNIIMEVRKKLNNPAMTIVIGSVDFHYFDNV